MLFVGGRPTQKRASSVGRSGHFGVVCRSSRSVDTVGRGAETEDVAFIGELTDADEPWTSVIVMEEVGMGYQTDVCFKLDTGADVTVISAADHK